VRDAPARLRVKIGPLTEAVEYESRSRELADQRIQRQLEEFAAGGLHLETIGLVWLLLGVTLGTAPGEVVWLVKMLIHLIILVVTLMTTLFWKIFS
jgi:hypothetical protein